MKYLKQLVDLYHSKQYHGYVSLVDRSTGTFYDLDGDRISIERGVAPNGCDMCIKEPVAVIEALLSAYLIDENTVWRYNRLIDGYQLSISMNGSDRLELVDFNTKPYRSKKSSRRGFNILEFLQQPWKEWV